MVHGRLLNTVRVFISNKLLSDNGSDRSGCHILIFMYMAYTMSGGFQAFSGLISGLCRPM